MNKLLFAMAMSLSSATAFAANSCEEIKSQIDAKIKALGVQTYKLDVVDADAASSGKQVGTCDGGKKKIVYWRM